MSVALPLPHKHPNPHTACAFVHMERKLAKHTKDGNTETSSSPHYERNMFAILLMTDSTGLAERVHDCS